MMFKVDPTDPRVKETRGDEHGPIIYMTHADGYVMCRRPSSMPWVEGLGIWWQRPYEKDVAPARAAYRSAFGGNLKASPLTSEVNQPNLSA